jgi:hypothetical protein
MKDVRRQAHESGDGECGARIGDVLLRDEVAGHDEDGWVTPIGPWPGKVSADREARTAELYRPV